MSRDIKKLSVTVSRPRTEKDELAFSQVHERKLTARLNAIIRLMIEQQFTQKSLQKKDVILLLDSVGLGSGDIGDILGQPAKDVASWLKRLKHKSSTRTRNRRSA